MTELINRNKIHETFSYGVIYVYSISDANHEGRLKIGRATVASLNPTQEMINTAAHERIRQQTKTADIPYSLEHAELSVTDKGEYFSDTNVHEVLIRSGYERKSENTKNVHSEWFEISLETAKNAIKAAKEGRKALTTEEKTDTEVSRFIFRPNQRDAIDKTTKAIKQNRKHFLWNAKMRFGKTSAAMQVAKENEMNKVLIVTHRPSVSADWYEDFHKVFTGTNYEYSSRTKGEHISTLMAKNKPFVYFASLQDLRLSKRVVSDEAAKSHARGFDKNDEVFDTTWDMMIVDEAHEGTQSNLGETTFTKIPANFTLQLSGTPFNILHKHEESDIYTWDYVMEQEEKFSWDERHPGVPNPYAELPALSMFTYDIDKFASHIGSLGTGFHDALDGAFKFHEFFRVRKDNEGNDIAEFVHEDMVNKFLDLLVDDKLHTKFPYASDEYRSYNKHSLWLLPNRVKVIEAMENLLKDHPVFGSGQFGIVNISGESRDDEEDKDAKDRVVKAISKHDYSITLTGQRLTTGASVPEWTAVFMMSDTSSATAYLQTAFRCQTPARIDGKLKTQGYVFDFAPDRTLRLIAEAIELNHKPGKTNTPEQRVAMNQFLNFCPILAAEGGTMKPYDVGSMLGQLKKAIIERVGRNGFDDPKLYNDELLKLDELEIKRFNELKTIVGSSSNEKINEIPVNDLGLDDVQTAKAENAERKNKLKKELTPEEKEALRKLKEARDQRQKAISILRAVSIRMPMMVYGANVSLREDITLQKFIDLVDDESWYEFMPVGLTKEKFGEFIKYYDEEVFGGVTRNIRAKVFDCDDLLPTERIQAIAEIFGTFKNPDKETVLTPWNVVNMHLISTFGGHDFRNIVKGKPEWISKDVDTSIWSKDDVKILEINSKSGLYPLLVTYNIYSRQLKKLKKPEDKISNHLWNEVLKNNIFVLCKSPMAQRITMRTLTGYKGANTNIIYINDLIQKLQKKGEYAEYNLYKELQEKFKFTDKDMKFTAVVGNPPYHVDSGARQKTHIWHHFLIAANEFGNYVSMIHPSGWVKGGIRLNKARSKWKKEKNLKRIVLYEADIFPNVSTGPVTITFFDNTGEKFSHPELVVVRSDGDSFTTHFDYHNNKFYKTDDDNKIDDIIGKFRPDDINLSLTSKVSAQRILGIEGKHFKHPAAQFSSVRTGVFMTKVLVNEKLSNENEKKEYYYINKLDKHWNIKKLYLNLWKVAFPATGNRQGKNSYILHPGELATDKYLIVVFETQTEAINYQKYLKTKLYAFAMKPLLVDQNALRKTHRNVPLQDFTENSDIYWSKSISEVDKQLYAKYGLSEDEVNFIETHVKAME